MVVLSGAFPKEPDRDPWLRQAHSPASLPPVFLCLERLLGRLPGGGGGLGCGRGTFADSGRQATAAAPAQDGGGGRPELQPSCPRRRLSSWPRASLSASPASSFFAGVRPPAAEMEPLAAASQLGAGRESGSSSSSSASSSSSSSPHSKQELQPYAGSSPLKPNQVGETSLYGVPIVSLVIDGQERLCLAQISNTLLKNYSYNEIHNRRVALGITCVQCTPVQLEILRRAGAMPISSRRCGMITKREAERLCKSFLGEHKPPKLPENFAFDVVHECAWGSRGSFIPARYNSSRAKCIKCSYCSMYFSPNKFIFHSHRTPDAKYTQPDAANFNSWRRHLKLSDKGATDDLSHAWEDVKAMFNGGTRKRTFSLQGGAGGGAGGSSAAKSSLHPPPPSPADLAPVHKSLRCSGGADDPPGAERGGLGLPAGVHGPAAAAVRSYPVIPVPSKGFGMLQKLPPPLFPPPYGFPAAAFGLCPKKQEDSLGGAGGGDPSKAGALTQGMFWGPPQPPQPPPPPQQPSAAAKEGGVYPSFPMFWPASGSLPVPPYPAQSQAKAAATAVVVAAAAAAAAAAAEPLGLRGPGHVDLEGSEPSGSERSSATPQEGSGAAEGERCPSALSRAAAAVGEEDRSGDEALLAPLPLPRKGSYLSAFRPVVKDAESIAKLYGTREAYAGPRGCPGYLSPDFLSEGSSSYRSLSPGNETVGEPEVDVESNRFAEDEDEEDEAPVGDIQQSPPPPPPPPLLLPEAEESLAAAAGGGLAAVEKAAEPEESPSERTSSRGGYEVRGPPPNGGWVSSTCSSAEGPFSTTNSSRLSRLRESVVGAEKESRDGEETGEEGKASEGRGVFLSTELPKTAQRQLRRASGPRFGLPSSEEHLSSSSSCPQIPGRGGTSRGSAREGRESWDAEAYPSGREECPQALKAGASLGPPIAPYLCDPEKNDPDHEDNHSAAEDVESRKPSPSQRSVSQSSPTHAERGEEVTLLDVTGTQLGEKDLGALARDELQRLLQEQMDLRKKLEREFQSLKDNFQDQMKRELAYREEMVQQLQIVRDTLCNELDQERKARYAIQQKLKEAHDALHHFSCKMLTPRHCAGNCSFKPPLLPQ
ncbi:SKI family transcriptional corepressor 1 [Candoia aspera]|uniref:SKI family transcriptional corepressor 1 n=1 Tax=Candoia aspera TaxID=51853 RepID=UPI002FD7E938